MKCPRCDESMETTNSKRVATNTCFYCSGTWISKDSLSELLKIEYGEHGNNKALEGINIPNGSESNRNCPTCSDQNLKAIFIEDIELDICPSCTGIFFDEGELKMVLPNSHGAVNELNMGHYAAMETSFWGIILLLGGI